MANAIIEPCRDLEDSLAVLNRVGFMYLHVSPLLPSLAEADKGAWWVRLIEERLAVNTKLVAGKTTLVSPEVFRLWTLAYGGSAECRCEEDMAAGLMDRDAYRLLISMLGKPPAAKGHIGTRCGLKGRQLTRAMGILQRRGWIVPAEQDRRRVSGMITFLWTTADDWWGDPPLCDNRQDRMDAWHEFIGRLAAACQTDPGYAQRLISWSPTADIA